MTAARVPNLSDILGQARALETLRASIASGRVHHAWVFSGPAGVGKFTTALAFAAMLLDPTLAPNLAGELDADESSPTRAMIAAGTHPDLHVITKELAAYSDDRIVRERKLISIPLEVIRTHLLGPIVRAPSVRTASLIQKAFIVDEAELMDRSKTSAFTQNTLLKTLEEPPPGSVIILVTSQEDRLLPTIRSRCQRVVFTPIDPASMSTWFRRAEKSFPRPVNTDERAWVERFAAGSPGRALQAVETGLFEWARTLEPLLARADRLDFAPELGPTMGKLVGGWAEAWVDSHKNASKEAANLAAVRHLAALLSDRFRERVRHAASAGDFDTAEAAALRIEAVARAERYVAASVNMNHALDALAVALASAPAHAD